MLTTVNLIPIHREHVEIFLRNERSAGAIYREYGGLGNEILLPVNIDPGYGCAAYGATLDLAPDEVVCIVLDRFRDRDHYEAVMARVNADPRIDAIFGEFKQLVDLRRVVRGEFERA
jgi:uncharacterized protein YbaA (DUF1428 family)